MSAPRIMLLVNKALTQDSIDQYRSELMGMFAQAGLKATIEDSYAHWREYNRRFGGDVTRWARFLGCAQGADLLPLYRSYVVLSPEAGRGVAVAARTVLARRGRLYLYHDRKLSIAREIVTVDFDNFVCGWRIK